MSDDYLLDRAIQDANEKNSFWAGVMTELEKYQCGIDDQIVKGSQLEKSKINFLQGMRAGIEYALNLPGKYKDELVGGKVIPQGTT